MIRLKRILLFVLLIAIVGTVYAQEAPWPTYTGRMFSIKYPPSFTARAGTPESAFFQSPDGLVEFYVYSAYFTAESNEYKIIRDKEICVAYEVQKGKLETITYVTLKVKDGSYLRSYADILSHASGRRVFGFRYHDQKAYGDYRPVYLRFKVLLDQYADGGDD